MTQHMNQQSTPAPRSSSPRSRLILAATLGILAGIVADRLAATAFEAWDVLGSKALSSFELMAQAWGVIHKVYVDRSHRA
jgi:hypothetical protein